MRQVVLSWMLVLGLGTGVSARAAARLAALPELTVSNFPPEVRGQVQQAYGAARRHPRDAEASGRLGMLLDLYHRPDQAEACYRRAHQLDPKSFAWLYYLGSLLARQGKAADAASTLRAALTLEPGYLPARLKLADSLWTSGQTAPSHAAYAAILQEFPDTAEAYWGLGRIEVAEGNLRAGRQSFGRACTLFPRYGAAHYALAQVERKLGDSEEAGRELALYARNRSLVPPVADPLRDALRKLDRGAASLVERGVELEQAGRLDDAIAAHERALELDPKFVQAHVNLINLYGRVGNFAKAEEHYRAVVELDPDRFPAAYYDYGLVLLKQSKWAEAERAFQRALAINPHYAQAHNDLGYLLERQGKLSAATAEYRKAIQDQSGFRQAHFNLGRLLVNAQQYQEGIEQLRQTLSPVDENTPTYLYALGAAYGRAGETGPARHYLEEARRQASARGQAQLLADIEKDIARLNAP